MNFKQFLHPKLALSFCIWMVTYALMGIFGGSVAFYHFPRVIPKRNHPVPLPDFGYDIIPYWCPLYKNENLQSIILLFFYIIIFVGALFKAKNQGRLMIQQLLHLNSIIFLMRTTTVGITGLPQPNPRCIPIQSKTVTYLESIKFVMLRGFPPHACGDLVFSGHVACTLICIVIFHKYDFLNRIMACAVIFFLQLLAIFSVISCRSHYSIDAILATYFVYFTQYWYFSKSESISAHQYVKSKSISRAVQLIAWPEDKSTNFDYLDKDGTDCSSDGSIDSTHKKIFV